MSVTVRTPAHPRVVGSDYARYGGGKATLYGEEGEQCHYPGCHVLLSAYNERDVCCCHPVVGKKRKPRKRGESRSAHGEAVTEAAEAPRRVTREELEMAAAKRQEMSDAKKAVLEALTDGYEAAPRIAERAGVKESLAYYHLKRLVDFGKGGGYRARQDVVKAATVKAEAADCQGDQPKTYLTCDDVLALFDDHGSWSRAGIADKLSIGMDEARSHLTVLLARGEIVEEPGGWYGRPTFDPAPADPTGAAPDTSPERPAEPAAPSPHDAESPAAGTMPPPFAGVDPRAFEAPAWSAPVGQLLEAQPIRYLHSPEVECMALLERLDDDARERVLTWGIDRWPVHGEVVVRLDCAPSAEAMAEAVLGMVKGAGQ